MSFISTLTSFIIRIFAWFFRGARVKDRIIFSSYFSNELEGNLLCIKKELQKQTSLPIVVLCTSYHGGFFAKIKYIFHTLKETYYFQTSKVVVLEGNSIVLSAIKKKPEVSFILVWHAAGAFKHFGEDTSRLYSISGLDAVLVSSPAVIDIYAHALNVPPKNIVPIGIPRADVLTDPDFSKKAKQIVYDRYPSLAGKKIALYAPTFRGKGVSDIQFPEIDLSLVSKSLNHYALALRLHPLMDTPKEMVAVDFTDFDYLTALAAADVLITDYSSVIFEYALLKRPMLFFAPDLAQYEKRRGFYFDYETFIPGKLVTTQEELISTLNTEDFDANRLAAFETFFSHNCDGGASKRAVEFILSYFNNH